MFEKKLINISKCHANVENDSSQESWINPDNLHLKSKRRKVVSQQLVIHNIEELGMFPFPTNEIY